MPVISIFYGITIKMYFDDHAPPHYHAEYGDHELIVAIFPLRILAGSAPGRVRSMVLEWSALHQQELMSNWERCKTLHHPHSIEPLE
jgi:hypothetical protein